MSFYVHIPFCTVRCGYCDFNTYTAKELGSGSSQASYAATVSQEISFARGVMDKSDIAHREIETVFFGVAPRPCYPLVTLFRY